MNPILMNQVIVYKGFKEVLKTYLLVCFLPPLQKLKRAISTVAHANVAHKLLAIQLYRCKISLGHFLVFFPLCFLIILLISFSGIIIFDKVKPRHCSLYTIQVRISCPPLEMQINRRVVDLVKSIDSWCTVGGRLHCSSPAQ